MLAPRLSRRGEGHHELRSGYGFGRSRGGHEALESEFSFGGGGGDPGGGFVGDLGVAVAQTLPEPWYLVAASVGGFEVGPLDVEGLGRVAQLKAAADRGLSRGVGNVRPLRARNTDLTRLAAGV